MITRWLCSIMEGLYMLRRLFLRRRWVGMRFIVLDLKASPTAKPSTCVAGNAWSRQVWTKGKAVSTWSTWEEASIPANFSSAIKSTISSYRSARNWCSPTSTTKKSTHTPPTNSNSNANSPATSSANVSCAWPLAEGRTTCWLSAVRRAAPASTISISRNWCASWRAIPANPSIAWSGWARVCSWAATTATSSAG